MTQLAEIKQLSVAFQSKEQTLKAVDSLTFALNPSETLVLLGRAVVGNP